MTTKIAQMRKTIQKHAEALGLSIVHQNSGLSASEYLYISTSCDSEDLSWKVRISDHDLPQTYGCVNGYADFEVGPHGCRPCEVIADIAEEIGKPIPASIKAYLTRIRKAEERIIESNKAWKAHMKQVQSDIKNRTTPLPPLQPQNKCEIAMDAERRAKVAGKFQTELDEIKALRTAYYDNHDLSKSARRRLREKIITIGVEIAAQLDSE